MHHLGSFGTLLGSLGGRLGTPWTYLEALLGRLGLLWTVSWGVLERLEHLSGRLGASRAPLGASWSVFVASGASFCMSWDISDGFGSLQLPKSIGNFWKTVSFF